MVVVERECKDVNSRLAHFRNRSREHIIEKSLGVFGTHLRSIMDDLRRGREPTRSSGVGQTGGGSVNSDSSYHSISTSTACSLWSSIKFKIQFACSTPSATMRLTTRPLPE